MLEADEQEGREACQLPEDEEREHVVTERHTEHGAHDLQRRALTTINRLGDQTRRDNRLRDLAGRSLDWLAAAGSASDHQLAHARTVVRSAIDDGQLAIVRGWLEGRGIPDS